MTHLGPFSSFEFEAWPYHWQVRLLVHDWHGGTPRNPDVVRSWLQAKAGVSDESAIQNELARIFVTEPGVTDEEAVAKAIAPITDRHLNGFRRDAQGLYGEGRHLKACIKEAVSICVASGKLPERFGKTKKGTKGFVAEHVCVADDKLYFGRQEHDEVQTRFVPNRFGTGITVEEVCFEVEITSTIFTDYDFTQREWAMIWLTAEQNGIGASRSQGFGTFSVLEWTKKEGS